VASQIPYQTAVGTTSFINVGATGQLLKSNGTSAPYWGGIPNLADVMASGNTASTSLNMNSKSITNIANLNEIITSINVLSGSPNSANIVYTTGGVYYITPYSSENFKIFLTNLPSTTNTTYVITLLIDSNNYNSYCNDLTVNGTIIINGSSTPPLIFSGGIANIITTPSVILMQTIAIIILANTSIPVAVMTSISPYY
jgi:hypothetical protein